MRWIALMATVQAVLLAWQPPVSGADHRPPPLANLASSVSSRPVAPWVRARGEYRMMTEPVLAEEMEKEFLRGDRRMEQAACEVMLDRYPSGAHAARASYRLAVLGLASNRKWDRSVEALRGVGERFGSSDAGQEANWLYEAMTDPKGVLHLEMLSLLYLDALEDRFLPVWGVFLANRVARFMQERPVREWISSSRQITDLEKAGLGYDLAEMAFWAGEFELSEEMAKWVLEEYPEAGEACAISLALLGDICLNLKHDVEGAQTYFRRIVDDYGFSEQAPAALYRLGCHLEQRGEYRWAEGVFNEVRRYWPSSKWSEKSLEIQGMREMVDALGPVRVSAGLDRERPAVSVAADRRDLISPESRMACGPFAFYRACRDLGVSCTLSEAQELCRVSETGESSFKDLASAFAAKGLMVEGARLGREDLDRLANAQGRSVVLHLRGRGHFMLLSSSSDSGVDVRDRLGTYRLGPQRLQYRWGGYALVVSPAGSASVFSKGVLAESGD